MRVNVRFVSAMAAALSIALFVSAPAHSGAGAISNAEVQKFLLGVFDNREQVAQAPPAADPDAVIPRVVITIEPAAQSDWSLWHVHLSTDADTSYDQTWAMRVQTEHDGSQALIPYYQLKQTETPRAAAFDAREWLSLEACALRGDFHAQHIQGISEGEQCVAQSMSVGARRALLPVGIERDGDLLRVDLNIRNTRLRIDAKRQ